MSLYPEAPEELIRALYDVLDEGGLAPETALEYTCPDADRFDLSGTTMTMRRWLKTHKLNYDVRSHKIGGKCYITIFNPASVC